MCDGILKNEHKTLISLDISCNEINHFACEYIHELLLESNILKLSLAGNNIGNLGADKLS